MPWPFTRRHEASPSGPRIDPAGIVRRARRLRFQVRPEAVAALAGAYHGARAGAGLTFSELRPYEAGDDLRHLDWNVTARQNRPYVRRYVEERALLLWLIVDISASMRFGPDGRTKADRAAQAAALLAAAALHNGDRAGLMMISDRIDAELAPKGGPRQLARLLRMLVATPGTSRATMLSACAPILRRRGRRGLVVVLSDFLETESIRPWREVQRRHDLIALRLVEPREATLPAGGLLRITDPETGRSLVVDSGSARVRRDYARAAVEHQAAFQGWCAAVEATGHDLATDVDPITALLGLFNRRARRGGGRR